VNDYDDAVNDYYDAPRIIHRVTIYED